MRDRWKPLVVVLGVTLAAGILAAVAWAAPAITVTNLQVRANSEDITSGPLGAGYDIRISATVSETRWESTRWIIQNVPRCVDHSDQDAGNRAVNLYYEFESNPVQKELLLPDPAKVGPSEHVFPPPPGGASQLRVELFNNDSCSGSPLGSSQIALTTHTPGPNKPLTAACQGMKVAVVLDESGSIESAGATQEVRDATKALARGLIDTGAQMAVFKFSTTASSNFIRPYQAVTQSWVNGALDDYLDDYDPGGSTNWQSGLSQARNQTLSNVPDLVVFLTDGNPNRLGNGNTGYEEGYYSPVSAAATVSDQFKQTSHMFVIGVGDGVTDALSALRIQSVSGTLSFPEYPISTADYTLITDFNELEEALEDIASNLCNVTVIVKKETDELVRDVWLSRPAWTFSGRTVLRPPAAPFSYGWYEPQRVDPVTSTSATQSGITGPDGNLAFVWRPKAADSLSDITISESVPPAYAPVSATCVSGGQTILSSQVPSVVTSFTLGGLKIRDHVDCTVRNRVKRSVVRVVKNWVGPAASATIFVDQDGAAPFDASTTATTSGASASFTYPVSTAATVGETSVPAGYSATIDCGGGQQAYAGGPFPVTSPAVDGATLTCTITNTQLRSTVRVVKQWIGAPSTATIFVDANGTAPFDASTVATVSGATASFDYPVSTPVFVGEVSVPAGYSATIDCGNGPQPYAGGPFGVTSPAASGAMLTCTITNEQQFSTVRVVKHWIGTPSSATIFVDQDGVAPFDAETVATVSGASASFDYPVSTPVFVGEVAVPAGYTATIDCGAGLPQPYSGGPFAVTSPAIDGATLTCTIMNILPPPPPTATVRVVKQWVGTPSSATIFVDQDGVIPFDAETVATATGDSASFDYVVSTPVTVGEVTVPTGYSATIDCGTGPQPYGGGPFPVTAPAVAGATLTCTITNTEQLSTVRVIKHWVGPPTSATIFVDQNGVAPFDAETVATTDGASASFDYPVSTPVTVGEVSVPAGYSATIDCGNGPQSYSGGPFAVTSPATDGATLSCTITNSQIRSTVQVVKQWSGGASSATIFVDQTGSAPYDASTVATESGQSASFTYPVSTPATVGESPVPIGFRAVIDCGAGPQDYPGGPFQVTSPAVDGATLTCTITNSPLTTVRVEKIWGGPPDATQLFVDLTGLAPLDATTIATSDGESVSFDYPPSTQVALGEIAVPPGYRSFIDCGNGPREIKRYAGGPFSVLSPATPGGVLTCTVANVKRVEAARLVVTKTAKPTVLHPGERVVFTIKVTNKGPGIARDVRVCDRLPPGLELVRAPGATKVGGLLCWTIGRLPPKRSRRFVVVAKAAETDQRIEPVNVVTISGANTINCPRLTTIIRRQRQTRASLRQAQARIRRQLQACSARARVVVEPRRSGVLAARVRITFTG